jgi:hypothetical protein
VQFSIDQAPFCDSSSQLESLIAIRLQPTSIARKRR